MPSLPLVTVIINRVNVNVKWVRLGFLLGFVAVLLLKTDSCFVIEVGFELTILSHLLNMTITSMCYYRPVF